MTPIRNAEGRNGPHIHDLRDYSATRIILGPATIADESFLMLLGIIILGIAAFWNIRHGTVPNWLVACLLFSFVATVLVTDLPTSEIKSRAAVFAVTLLIFFVLFCFEIVGGGAAKLISVTALWLAWPVSALYSVALVVFTIGLELLSNLREGRLLEQLNEHHATIAAVFGMLLLSIQLWL